MRLGKDEEYFFSEFRRTFSNEAAALAWGRALKDKRIPVHVEPDRPVVSAVILNDIDARFGPPAEDGTPGLAAHATTFRGLNGIVIPDRVERLPRRLRPPTEIGVWLAGLGFCLSLADHLSRLVAGKPIHPDLVYWLWGVAAVIGIPFWVWFQNNTGISIANWPGGKHDGPYWLRILRYAFDMYVFLGWTLRSFQLDKFLHLHLDANRLDPFMNGAFLALVYGNAAATLYAALDRIEDPSNPATWGLNPE
jgi:hypothetical protein